MTRMVNRYVVEPVDNGDSLLDGKPRTWAVRDRKRDIIVADRDTRTGARKVIWYDLPREKIPAPQAG